MASKQTEPTIRDLFSSLTDAELGAAFREYVAESDHQSWDGWRKDQKTGVNELLRDMYRYYSSLTPEDLPLHGRAVTYGAYYDGPDQLNVPGRTILS